MHNLSFSSSQIKVGLSQYLGAYPFTETVYLTKGLEEIVISYSNWCHLFNAYQYC